MENEIQHLDLAHRERRRSDKFVKLQKFEEALEAHKKAVVYLKKVLAVARHPSVVQSVELQIDYHTRQLAVVKYKQDRYRSLELLRQQHSMSNKTSGTSSSAVNTIVSSSSVNDPDASLVKILQMLANSEPVFQQVVEKLSAMGGEDQLVEQFRAKQLELSSVMEKLAQENDNLRRTNTILLNELEALRTSGCVAGGTLDDGDFATAKVDDSLTSLPELAPLERFDDL